MKYYMAQIRSAQSYAAYLRQMGDVTLYFMEAKTMRRCEMPADLKEKLKEFF